MEDDEQIIEDKKKQLIIDFNNKLEEQLQKNNIVIIEEDQLVRGEVIGEGAFGKVYNGTLKGEHVVAIKKLLLMIK